MSKLLSLNSPTYLRRLAKVLNKQYVVYWVGDLESYRVKTVRFSAETQELIVTLFNEKKITGRSFKFCDGNGKEIVAERIT